MQEYYARYIVSLPFLSGFTNRGADCVRSSVGCLLHRSPFSCHSNGSLTLLFLPISRHSKNILHASSHSASISVTSTIPAASRPRVSLLGNITVFTDIHSVPGREAIQGCYLEKHRDAKWWLPDDEGAAHVVRSSAPVSISAGSLVGPFHLS